MALLVTELHVTRTPISRLQLVGLYEPIRAISSGRKKEVMMSEWLTSAHCMIAMWGTKQYMYLNLGNIFG